MEIDFLILKIIMQADIMSVTPQMQKQQIWMNNTRLELKLWFCEIVILWNCDFFSRLFYNSDTSPIISSLVSPVNPIWQLSGPISMVVATRMPMILISLTVILSCNTNGKLESFCHLKILFFDNGELSEMFYFQRVYFRCPGLSNQKRLWCFHSSFHCNQPEWFQLGRL